MGNSVVLNHPELTPAQRAAVIEEKNRILEDPLFKGSNRCVELLSHLLECALRGEYEILKERTLGVDVFGRDPSYDTSADPIVRRTAGEVRKRLAEYYQEHGPNHAVKIRLIRGTYYPQFDFSNSDHSDFDNAEDSERIPDTFTLPVANIPRLGRAKVFAQLARGHMFRWLVGIAILAFAAGFAFYRFQAARSASYSLWEPLLASNKPLIVCISDDPSLVGSISEEKARMINVIIASRKPPAAAVPLTFTNSFTDARDANMISAWLTAHGRPPNLRGSYRTTMADIKGEPLVLIGGFDNPWSLILLSDLRYRIRIDPATLDEWIEDARNPSKREWKTNAELQYADFFVDYAIITRFWDRETGSWVMAVSGLGPYGGNSAAQLLTVDSLAKSLPAGIYSKTNFQIVLKTAVLAGTIGPPQVLAVHTW